MHFLIFMAINIKFNNKMIRIVIFYVFEGF